MTAVGECGAASDARRDFNRNLRYNYDALWVTV
jgi:hypothetical protein